VTRRGAWPLAQLSFDIGEPYRRVRLTVSETGVTLTSRRSPSHLLVLGRAHITGVGWSRWFVTRGQLWIYTTQSPVGFVVVLKLSHVQAAHVARRLGVPLRHADCTETDTNPWEPRSTAADK
jgi:hypothetical protein